MRETIKATARERLVDLVTKHPGVLRRDAVRVLPCAETYAYQLVTLAVRRGQLILEGSGHTASLWPVGYHQREKAEAQMIEHWFK